MDAVHADWKEYLNLLICEENHLKNMDDYHKVSWHYTQLFTALFCLLSVLLIAWFLFVQFQKDARDTSDLLKRLETEINQKYNPEFKDMYQMEGLIADLDVNIYWIFHCCFLIHIMCIDQNASHFALVFALSYIQILYTLNACMKHLL